MRCTAHGNQMTQIDHGQQTTDGHTLNLSYYLKWRFLSVELEKNCHFVTNFGYLRNKDRVFGQKTPQIEK